MPHRFLAICYASLLLLLSCHASAALYDDSDLVTMLGSDNFTQHVTKSSDAAVVCTHHCLAVTFSYMSAGCCMCFELTATDTIGSAQAS